MIIKEMELIESLRSLNLRINVASQSIQLNLIKVASNLKG